ncbi:hypothetical protein LSTR_LSTR001280 [Laodelphax striatellus]|uniref:Chromatin target of PRMT1 protein C-terminal domain-containing protein n=1 Tax=Laodelphax striatellus TaxID=195883 RepID=A0A482XBR5_LAOST|nr:hypothetical protein LSTR_LSTR001280 [Laodelphax striatellus]
MAFINRPMQKVILNSSTKMSLHERFTYLRSQSEAGAQGRQQTTAVAAITSKNRRLAQQMERRPAVMAALKIKKRSLKQRLGQTTSFGGSVKDRLTLTRRGSLRGGRLNLQAGLQRRGRTRGRKPIGGGVGGRLSRSQSMQSLNGSNAQQRMRSRSRSRSRVRSIAPSQGGGGRGGAGFRRGGGPGASWMRERVNLRGGGMRGGGGGGGGRGVRRGFVAGGGNWRGRSFQGQRGRSNFRGRGMRGGGGRGARGGRGNWRGRGGGGGNRGTVPTKEELDSQLDQYMASSQNTMDLS